MTGNPPLEQGVALPVRAGFPPPDPRLFVPFKQADTNLHPAATVAPNNSGDGLAGGQIDRQMYFISR